MYVYMYVYVCMYGHTCSKSMDQPGKVANVVSWTGKINNSLSVLAPEEMYVCMYD